MTLHKRFILSNMFAPIVCEFFNALKIISSQLVVLCFPRTFSLILIILSQAVSSAWDNADLNSSDFIILEISGPIKTHSFTLAVDNFGKSSFKTLNAFPLLFKALMKFFTNPRVAEILFLFLLMVVELDYFH